MQSIIETSEPLGDGDGEEPTKYVKTWGWFIHIDWLAKKLRITNNEIPELGLIEFINWSVFYRDQEKQEKR